MKRLMFVPMALASILAADPAQAFADDASKGATKVALVELFTSEG